MARTPFPVEVLTPEGQVFEGEVEMLSTRTEVGEIGVLAHHAPVLAMLARRRIDSLEKFVGRSATTRNRYGSASSPACAL